MSKHTYTVYTFDASEQRFDWRYSRIGVFAKKAIADRLAYDLSIALHATPALYVTVQRDDQDTLLAYHAGVVLSRDAFFAIVDASRAARIAASDATYSVMPDCNDDAKCQYMARDYAGTFDDGITSQERACEMARVVSRCVASHVFVTSDAGDCDYETVAIYRRGALVSEETYNQYAYDALFAHERAPATPAAPYFVTLTAPAYASDTSDDHWYIVARNLSCEDATQRAQTLSTLAMAGTIVRVHAGTPDDQCIISMWRDGEEFTFDAWLALAQTPATP